MSLSTQVRLQLARWARKASGFSIVPDWVTASVLSPTFRSLTREGYQRNSAFFACVSALAFAFPEPPLRVYEDDDPEAPVLPRHPLRTLLIRPNTRMGEATLMTTTIAYLGIGGNAYWHKVRPKSGRGVIELWPYHAGQISPVPGGDTWITRYVFDHGDGSTTNIPAEDIVHFRWPAPDPTQPWMALPPLVAAAAEVDADNEATRYLRALLINDAVPRTMVRVPADRYLTDDEVRRTKDQFKARFGGDNRGDVAILEGGASVERLSLNLQELAFEALHKIPETRIAAALRVPPIIAGLNSGLDRSTFANYGEARTSFRQETCATLWRLVESEIEQSLAPEFDGRVPRFDRSTVAALQEDENKKWTRVIAARKAGLLTSDEGRSFLGLPALTAAQRQELQPPPAQPSTSSTDDHDPQQQLAETTQHGK